MAITKKVFDTDKNTGKTVYEYTLENKNGMKAHPYLWSYYPQIVGSGRRWNTSGCGAWP